LATLNTDELKLEKAASKPADNKSVDDFWEAGSAEKTKAENPETIDFDKAASMGLIPSEHPKNRNCKVRISAFQAGSLNL
jgi:hypothetical protein